MLTRRTSIKVVYEDKDITRDIEKDVMGFSYTDNASGTADDISITLRDNNKKWINEWKPTKGDRIEISIETLNWRHEGDNQRLNCGKFMVDDVDYSGRPRSLTIGAISTPANSDFMQVPKNRTWSHSSLKEIATSLTKNYHIGLFYDTNANPIIQFIEQSDQSDSSFLLDLCKKNGLAIKIYNEKLVIFSEQEYESKKSVDILDEKDMLSWSAKNSWADTGYKSCEVAYTDPVTNNNYKYIFTDAKSQSNKVYKVNETVSSYAEAQVLAKSILRERNKTEHTFSFSVPGNVKLVASSCVDIVGFGLFDGKYYIDKVTHNINGFTSNVDTHRVLEGY